MTGGKKKRGPGAAGAVLLAGAVCCWMGLVRVDRQIRSVTIHRSPPLWEVRAEGELRVYTVLGKSLEVDLGPVRGAAEELRMVLETPPAGVRVAMIAAEWFKGEPPRLPPP